MDKVVSSSRNEMEAGVVEKVVGCHPVSYSPNRCLKVFFFQQK